MASGDLTKPAGWTRDGVPAIAGYAWDDAASGAEVPVQLRLT